MEKKASTPDIVLIANSLKRVNDKTTQIVMDIAKQVSRQEVVSLFNQAALDFFQTVLKITQSMGQEREYGIKGYLSLFETAIGINKSMPIDQFTMSILEHAAEIYAEDEDKFLNMDIPDTEIKSGNEFNVIKSGKIKNLWKTGSPENKELVKEKVITLTTWCHVFFIQKIMELHK
uniref:Uncharacterized protein n=1 Tax=viral metagenome TaxID=1070528 RepID=A0A6C0C9V3_9ZZZZ